MENAKTTLLALAAALGLAGAAQGQFLFETIGDTYTQNFNTIDEDNTSGNNIVLPANWSATGESIIYRGISASGTTGGLYGYNSETLGYLPSSSADNIQFTFSMFNNTGTTITSLDISYVGEQWRAVSGRENSWVVEVDSGSGFAALGSLTFTPNTDGTLAAAATIAGSAPVNIADQSAFSIRWISDRGTGSGSSQGISFDDVSVTAVPEPGSFALIAGFLGLTWVALRRRAA